MFQWGRCVPVTGVPVRERWLYIIVFCFSINFCKTLTKGLGRWEAVWLTGGICIFYTSIGGLKAVVWTDSFQICIMLAGFVAFIIKGSIDFGMRQEISKFSYILVNSNFYHYFCKLIFFILFLWNFIIHVSDQIWWLIFRVKFYFFNDILYSTCSAIMQISRFGLKIFITLLELGNKCFSIKRFLVAFGVRVADQAVFTGFERGFSVN